MEKNKQIGNWFMPADSSFSGGEKRFISPELRVAWWGGNQKFDNVGVYVYGMKNPHPEKNIKYKTRRFGKSVYACFKLTGLSARTIKLGLRSPHG